MSQISLGGAGILPNGLNASMNYNIAEGRSNFNNIDGLEVVLDNTGSLYAIIQEDASSIYGDRMLIVKLEHAEDGNELKYYFVAMSGGGRNSRTAANVGIPRGTGRVPLPHEFSGVFDISGLVYKERGRFFVSASDTGKKKRDADAKVNINDKLLVIPLQAHSMSGGVIDGFRTDRGGQLYLYKPNIPQ